MIQRFVLHHNILMKKHEGFHISWCQLCRDVFLNFGGRVLCKLNTLRALFCRVSLSSILIVLKFLSWSNDNLSINILYSTSMHKVLCLVNQESSICSLKTHSQKDFGKISCHMFILPNLCRSVLIWAGTSRRGTCSICIIVLSSIKEVKSSYINLNTSCSSCANSSLLKFKNNSCLQSSACKV